MKERRPGAAQMAAVWAPGFGAGRATRPQRTVGLLGAVALHVAVVGALLTYQPTRQALLDAAPIMIDLIVPPKVEAPKPPAPAELPKPRPVARKAVRMPEPPPIITAPAEAPSPVVAPAPPPAPPPIEVVAPPPPAPPPPLTEPVYRADYLNNPAPSYPVLSRRYGEEGRVVLRVRVNTRGGADEVQVNRSSGFVRLDDAARDAVRRWKFVPARRGAEPVPAWVLIPISFRLED